MASLKLSAMNFGASVSSRVDGLQFKASKIASGSRSSAVAPIRPNQTQSTTREHMNTCAQDKRRCLSCISSSRVSVLESGWCDCCPRPFGSFARSLLGFRRHFLQGGAGMCGHGCLRVLHLVLDDSADVPQRRAGHEAVYCHQIVVDRGDREGVARPNGSRCEDRDLLRDA